MHTNYSPSVGTSFENSSTGSDIDDGIVLGEPILVVFPEVNLDYSWNYPGGGAGLNNKGNTCFLNAVTQCLVHTPPLTNYLLSGFHLAECKIFNKENCILCKMEKLVKRSLLGPAKAFTPKWFVKNLPSLSGDFICGQQEDAIEYLHLSLEQMQHCILEGTEYGYYDMLTRETTAIKQMFGGITRSQVKCLKCGALSNTYDPVLDISLDIKNAKTLEQAFKMFIAAEKLNKENSFYCERCKKKVSALKNLSIHKAPNILTVQLKRFRYSTACDYEGGKIDKSVEYPARLDLRPFLSDQNGPPAMYSLYATIQHEGTSCTSGHYTANIRCGNKWFNFDDTKKKPISTKRSLKESDAYVLFYVKEQSPSPVATYPLESKSHCEEKFQTPEQSKLSPKRAKSNIETSPEKKNKQHTNKRKSENIETEGATSHKRKRFGSESFELETSNALPATRKPTNGTHGEPVSSRKRRRTAEEEEVPTKTKVKKVESLESSSRKKKTGKRSSSGKLFLKH